MEQKLEAICLKNVTNWLKFRNIPYPVPLSVSQDRVLFPKLTAMRAAIYRSVADGILFPGNYKNHGKTAVDGFRENCGTYSAQVIIHVNHIEVDFDYFNPWDVVGIIGHGWEVARNKILGRKTDPRKVAKALKERGIGEDDNISG